MELRDLKILRVLEIQRTDMTENPARKWNKDASYSHCTASITPFREIMGGNDDAARRMEITRRRGLLIQKGKKVKTSS
jgi:hypothetical protein